MIFFILKSLVVLAAILSGFLLSKNNASGNYQIKYTIATFPVILIYTLVEGLRYGRGTDYLSYAEIFSGVRNQFVEPLFDYFSVFLQSIGAHFSMGFLLSSLLLIFSGCFLIRRFRFAALFALPLFYLVTIEQSSNLVRMYFAFSFIFFALAYLIDRKKYLMYFFLTLAFFSHFSTIFPILLILLFIRFKNPFYNSYIILALYFLTNIFIVSNEYIYSQLPMLSYFDLYANYIDGADKWLLGNGIEDDRENNFGIFYYIRFYLNPAILLLLGYGILDKYEKYRLNVFYNLFLVGVLFRPIAYSISSELFYRIDLFFLTFSFVIAAFLFYDFKKHFFAKHILARLCIIYLFIDSAYLLFKTAFVYDPVLGNNFIWEIL